MAGFYRDLVRILTEASCVFRREGRGDHEIWYSPVSDCCFTIDKHTRSRHTANETLKQAGLPKQF
jgi:hypothetical protein